jgi:2-keto-4-pentenoate hydratase
MRSGGLPRRRRAAWDAEPVGFTISVTGRVDQERIGATEPTFGRLTDGYLLPSAARIALAAANEPLLEGRAARCAG